MGSVDQPFKDMLCWTTVVQETVFYVRLASLFQNFPAFLRAKTLTKPFV